MTRWALLLVLLAAVGTAAAHEVRPAYLELRQTQADVYDVLWKVPARGDDLRFGLYVVLPADCELLEEPRGRFVGGSYVERWRIRRAGGLAGALVRIEGLQQTLTDVLVRIERSNGAVQAERLSADDPSFVVAAAPSAITVAQTYLKLGVEHILLGVDHLAFVLALLILVQGVTRLVATITAFTVAHSLSLAGAALGWVHTPGPPIEASIALSIMFVAAEIVHARRGQISLTAQRPWIVAFAFGILHGFGFAGALTEVGLPQGAIPLALLFFNLGVEVGQLAFIAVVLASIALARRLPWRAPAWAWRAPPYLIGSLGGFWALQRVVGFV